MKVAFKLSVIVVIIYYYEYIITTKCCPRLYLYMDSLIFILILICKLIMVVKNNDSHFSIHLGCSNDIGYYKAFGHFQIDYLEVILRFGVHY